MKRSATWISVALHALMAALLIIVVAAGIWGIPDEDAAILYSYSRNLAETGIISYIPSGPRAEGATDFAWMVSIALLQKLAVPNHLGAALLNAGFLILLWYRWRSIRSSSGLDSKTLNLPIAYSAFLGIVFVSGAAISGLDGFSSIAQMALLSTIFSSCLFQRYDFVFLLSSFYFVLLRPDCIIYYVVIVGSFPLSRWLIDRISLQSISGSVAADGHASSSQVGDGLLIKCWRDQPALWPQITTAALPLIAFVAYWVWRSFYFGNLMPLPFYVKQSQSSEFADVLQRLIGEITDNTFNRISVTVVLLTCLFLCCLPRWQPAQQNQASCVNGDLGLSSSNDLPAVRANPTENQPAIATPSGSPALWGAGLVTWSCFFAFQSFYLTRFNLLQNIWDRFHVPFLAVSSSFLGCYLLVHANRVPRPGFRSFASLMVVGALILSPIAASGNLRSAARDYYHLFTRRNNDNIYSLSLDLGSLHRRVPLKRMFVTEAGRLSYYSRIPSVDTWGLNTPEFSRLPLQDPAYVVSTKPDLVSMHVDFAFLRPEGVNPASLGIGRRCKDGDGSIHGYCGWNQMNQAIFDGARRLNYKLYLVPFSRNAGQRDRHDLFMVNPASTAAQALDQVLVAHQAVRVTDPSVLKTYKW